MYQEVTEYEKRQDRRLRELQAASFTHYLQQAQIARQTHADITQNTYAVLGLGEGVYEIAEQMGGVGEGLSLLRSDVNMMGYSLSSMGSSIRQMDNSINRLGMAFMNHFQEMERTNAARYEQITKKVNESISLLSDIALQMYSGNEMLREISVTQRSMYADLQQSISSLHETIKNEYRTRADELINLGLDCLNKNLLVEAADFFEKAIEKVQIDPLPHFLLGKIYAFGVDVDKEKNLVNFPKASEHMKLTLRYCKNDIATKRDVALMYAEAASILAKVYYLQAKLEEVAK